MRSEAGLFLFLMLGTLVVIVVSLYFRYRNLQMFHQERMAAMDRARFHNNNNVDRFRRLGVRPVDFVRAIEMAARALAGGTRHLVSRRSRGRSVARPLHRGPGSIR
jgi:3-deoxy-D-manno-octulosonic-acid transferase